MQQYHDNTMPSLMRVFRSALSREVDLLAEHMVPCYLQRLEVEKESLDSLTLNDLYNNPDLICSSYHDNQPNDTVVECPEGEEIILK